MTLVNGKNCIIFVVIQSYSGHSEDQQAAKVFKEVKLMLGNNCCVFLVLFILLAIICSCMSY